MPPHKPVKRLTDLALKASGECVYSYCKKLRTSFPCKRKSKDALSAPGCREAVQEVQDYLRGYIAPMVWDSVFQVVIDLNDPNLFRPGPIDAYYCGVKDELFILAVFLYDKVFLKCIRIRPLLFDKKSVQQQRVRHFWLENAPKLENLVAADLGSVRCEYEDIVLAFGRSCPNLEILKIDSDLTNKTKRFVFCNCGQLRDLQHEGGRGVMSKKLLKLLKNLEYMNIELESLIEQFKETYRFKLQSLQLYAQCPQQVEKALRQCPDLNDLLLNCDNSSRSDAMINAVAMSSPTLRSLTLESITFTFDNLDQLLTRKGKDLHTLNFNLCTFTTRRPSEMLRLIGDQCPNLTSLTFALFSYTCDDPAESLPTFPNLEDLEIDLWKHLPPSMQAQFVSQAVTSAGSLTSLVIAISSYRGFDFNAWLAELFASNAMKKLRRVVLALEDVDISLQVIRSVFDMCPELNYLGLRNPSFELELYLTQMTKEAKLNNLDLVIDC